MPHRSPTRLLRSLVLAGLAVTGLGLGAAAPASAATADEGWVRVAHLSPDTQQVDVTLAGLAGGGATFELSGVGYGAVSDYYALTPGTYVVSMVPTGAPEGTAPVISQAVEVAAGRPATVAAYGRNAALTTTVLSDDLTAPAAGQTRVRVVQASTTATALDVATSTGTVLATAAATGSAGAYTAVPAGPTTLALTSGGTTTEAAVDLTAGSIASLFVLDDASGGLVVKAVVDSATGTVPVGGIQTGGGWLAVPSGSASGSADLLGAVGVLAVLGSAALLIRLRTRGAVGAE